MPSIYKPNDARYKEKVTESFDRQQVMKTINASIKEIIPGQIELEFPFQQNLTQQHGLIHAGIISTVLDSACGYAAFSLMPEDAAVLTIEFKVNLLAPAKGTRFRALGKVKKPGRNITVAEGEMLSFTNNDSKLVATMVATIMAVYERPGIEN